MSVRHRSGRFAKTRSGELYRRSPWIISYWLGKQLVFENFATRKQITADPLICAVLDFFDEWHSPDESCRYLKDYQPASLRRTVHLLARHSFLQPSSMEEGPRERALRAWEAWNPAAGFFHLSTKDVDYDTVPENQAKAVRRLVRMKPMPRPVKDYPKAPHILLPQPKTDGEFARVLLERRTWRKYSSGAIGLSALGTLLGLTWGVQGWAKVPVLGPLALKTSPSGGALHPIEAYVVARNVRSLPPGLYHYCGAQHRLDLLRRGASSRQITRYLAGQSWFGGAAVVVLMTAVFSRTQWKYNYARAYRAVLMEAGHLCQTFCLVATWLGLAPFCTLALEDSILEKDLGVDGVGESILYAAGVGARPEKEAGARLRPAVGTSLASSVQEEECRDPRVISRGK